MRIPYRSFLSVIVLLSLVPSGFGWQAGTGIGYNHPDERSKDVASDSQIGADVTITSNVPLSDYSAYHKADQFFLEIPEKYDPKVLVRVIRKGIQNANVERRGGNVIIGLGLPSGISVRTNLQSNSIRVYFVPLEAKQTSLENRELERPGSRGPQTSSARSLSDHGPVLLAAIPDSAEPPLALSLPRTTPAQQPSAAGASSEIDLAVPESPAFVVLGLSPETVIRPATPRSLATSLLNGVDRRGNVQSGVAIDTAPYMLFAGDELTLSHYRTDVLTRILARTQVSFATAKGGSEDDKSAKLALGFHTILWDKGDPRLDVKLSDCYRDSLSLDLPGTPEQQLQVLKIRRDECRNAAIKRNWNRSSWVIGAAPSWITPTGNLGDARWNGGGFWTSFAYGFDNVPTLRDTSQLIFHARYRTDEQIPDPEVAGLFLPQDSLFLGSRLRVGAPDFNANFEGVYIHNKPAGKGSFDSYRLSFGGERKLTKDLWLSLTFGGEGGREDGKTQAFVLTSFKYAFSRGTN